MVFLLRLNLALSRFLCTLCSYLRRGRLAFENRFCGRRNGLPVLEHSKRHSFFLTVCHQVMALFRKEQVGLSCG